MEDRLEHSREVLRKRSKSTTARPSSDTQRGALLAQLVDASVTFSEEERTVLEALEAPFKMEELEAAFKQAGKGTAPGVSGITYRQWEEGPPREKRLTLVIFNKMLETATVPKIFSVQMAGYAPPSAFFPSLSRFQIRLEDNSGFSFLRVSDVSESQMARSLGTGSRVGDE